MDSVIAVTIAVSAAQIIVSAMGFHVVRRNYGVRFPTAFTLKVAAAGAIAGASTLWLRPSLGHLASKSWMIFPLAVQFTLVFYLLCRVMKPLNAEDYEVAAKASRRVPKLILPLVGEPVDVTPKPSEEPQTETIEDDVEVVMPDEPTVGPV